MGMKEPLPSKQQAIANIEGPDRKVTDPHAHVTNIEAPQPADSPNVKIANTEGPEITK